MTRFSPRTAVNVGEWYERVDLYVMSSPFQGFLNALAEAMAHGLPAVSFDCDTSSARRSTGCRSRRAMWMRLTAALDRLMADAALRVQFATRAVEARQRFSMERIARMWEELFAEVRL